MPQAPFVPVIPAGGAGTRLWPLSRRDRPKFLLDLTGGGDSLLQQTVQRLAPLADRTPIVVTGAAHAAAVTDQVGSRARVLAEPSPRNSMPAIALAAALVEREEPEAVIGSFAADHLIGDQDAFREAITSARRAAELGHLVTLGIRPTHPATGFGYIEHGAEDRQGPRCGGSRSAPAGTAESDAQAAAALRATGALPVTRFVEKPDQERAEEFLAAGTFSWNAGMFIVRAQVLLDELAAQLPCLARGARAIAAAHDTEEYGAVLAATWPHLTSIAIDHALAEPLAAAGKVAVVPARFAWDDVGDFAALARQLRGGPGAHGARGASSTREARGDGATGTAGARIPAAPGVADGSDVRVLGTASVDALSSTATVYGSTNRHIALVGLDGISIVDTEDALLVLADERAQDLARLVAGLDDGGHGALR